MAKQQQQVLMLDDVDKWFPTNNEEGIQQVYEEEEEEEEEIEEKEEDTLEEDSLEEAKDVKEEAVEEDDTEETYTKLQALKAGVEYLVEKFNVSYEKELETEEDVISFFEEFSNFYGEQKYETLKSQNIYVTKVLDILEEGGNVENLIELFKQSKEVYEIDSNTEEGQKMLIEKYYSEVVGWNKERIKKHLDRVEANDELSEESKEVAGEYQKHIAKKQEAEIAREKQLAQQREAVQKQKINALGGFLQTKGLKKEEIKENLAFVYQDAYRLPNGELITALDKHILDFQKNPDELFELIQFLKDKDKYVQTKISGFNSKKADKTFDTILKNQKNKKSGEEITEPSKQKEKTLPTLKFK